MKSFYRKNRVFIILMAIVVICAAIIIFLLAKYVINSNTGNKYGNRLDGIQDVVISKDKKSEMATTLEKEEIVNSVTVNVHGKVINFVIDFKKDATVDQAKSIAVKCLDFFEEEYRNFYDLQFLCQKSELKEEKEDKEEDKESKDVFPIIGYIKAGATTISWSNNAK